ncbi:ribose 5-phosphate isomerase B [Candidatus Woesearchaeota archaeon]|nr:ribose 5-phosphate isomerase B [Candidatus Woesearchaeota archaeon]MBW3016309.1 ribose 5-phosphate isomerase B [Candidatus Woesearchaeota archaeon]
MIVHIGADHAGFQLKEHLKKFLQKKGYEVKDWGAYKLVKTDDYPDYAAKVAKAVQKEGMGILICGSAEGICIAANKIKGIRAVPIWNTKLAKLSREHNDANVLCLSGWMLTKKQAEQIAITWLKTPFSNKPRHKRRIEKIRRLEWK